MFKNIKRNKLDFILTDMMPVEVSELLSFRQFYNYLNEDKNGIHKINTMLKLLEDTKRKNVSMYNTNWNSIPLNFSIYKRNRNYRKMSIPNPIGVLMSYSFISLYEKELLSELSDDNVFSLRYHTNNNRLYYKDVSKSIVKYFSKTAKLIQKQAIEQSGTYFTIKKYKSINDFTNSKKWNLLSTRFKKYLKMDYKDCFRSIYSHVFNWFQFPNIQASKDSKENSSLYTTLDSIVQKLNASATNGIIVGPEFSRMLAELFLQKIDVVVYNKLSSENLQLDRDYFIGRYVDDIFIFANNEQILEKIKNIYNNVISQYMISFNENKIETGDLPVCWSVWFNDTYILSSEISGLFYTDSDDQNYYYKDKSMFSNALKQRFNTIICKCKKEERETVVSYILSTLMNKIKPQKKNKIFNNEISKSRLLNFLDYAFYVYSFSISFNNTQKLISIITLISRDIDNKDKIKMLLNKMFSDYDIIFESNIFDIINLLSLCCDYKLELKSSTESILMNQIFQVDDPIVYANWLLYCSYDKNMLSIQKDKCMNIVKDKLEYLKNKTENIFMYQECWFLYIFKNCPFCTSEILQLIKDLLQDLETHFVIGINNNDASVIAKNVLIQFLRQKDIGFFTWNYSGKQVSEQITYRTFQKTIFRQNSDKYKIYDYASF